MQRPANASDRALRQYKAKRNFPVTPEPSDGGDAGASALSFVIQKHWARRLHYDFRLELDGTMKSWAVPKGPSFDSNDKRMAVQVEDHPIAYSSFEGTIPARQYGAGRVMIWDRGTWRPLGDPRRGYRTGRLKFELHGRKLRGKWMLIRMKGKGEKQQPWLLIKEKDKYVRSAAEYSVVDELPDGITVQPAPEAAPVLLATDTGTRRARARKKRKSLHPHTGLPPGATAAAMPAALAPQLATLAEGIPPDPQDWLYEIKFDGYRLMSRVDGADIKLFTRNGNNWTSKLLPLQKAIAKLKLPGGWYDGEIVVPSENGVPDFCYELCLRKVEESDIRGLDLSSWRFAFNGAEPVSPDTITAFSERFARYGFKPEAMSPVYGLAEATLGVSFPPPGRGPKFDRVDRDSLTQGGRAILVADGHPDALIFVACGRPLPGHQVRVVDASDRELSEREEGHVQFWGPSSTSGYYRNSEETRRLLHGDWVDSGDYGYIAEGELYITGRVKDIIIRAGRNLYPYELEDAVGALEGIRKGCVAVFGARDARSGTERVVVLAETRESDPARRENLRARINDLAVSLINMPADEVVLAPPHTVLKTSSGKIRRAASREVYESGGSTGTRAVWWQIVRLAWSAIFPQARRSLRAAGDRLYGLYFLLLLGVLGPATWIACALLPRADWCWRLTHRIARLLLRLAGVRFDVRGLEHVPAGRPFVLIVNHASFLDGPAVLAALPEPMCFVVKRELLDNFVSRIYLTRIGTEFVERFDAQRGVEDAGRVAEIVCAGRPVIMFPEGTFRRMPGLLPFRMGAFVIAAQAGVPVVPVTVRGTRSILREGQWLFRRGMISMAFSAPIEPTGTDWNAAVKLRDQARAEILRLCAEPDLDEETSLPPQRPSAEKRDEVMK